MDPHVGVKATALAVRGRAMVGLGLLNPFAALIPLIAPSNNKALPCNNLLAQMRARPDAPPPGQKMKTPRGVDAAASEANGGRVPAPSAPASSAPATRMSPASAAQYKGS